MTTYLYQVRTDFKSPNDFWPVSLHRTFRGAREKIRKLLQEQSLEVPSYFESILENLNSTITPVYKDNDGEIFVSRVKLEN